MLICASICDVNGKSPVDTRKQTHTLFVCTALLISVVPAYADDAEPGHTDMQGKHGYVLKPGEGEPDGFGGLIKASPKTGTQGVVFVEDRMPPSSTSGIHVHLEADEFFYVLEGTGHIRLGHDEHEVSAGDTIFVPVGTDHRITSSQENPLHVIFIVDRPGLDEQFRLEFGGLDRTKMTIDEFNAIVEKYGTVYKTFD